MSEIRSYRDLGHYLASRQRSDLQGLSARLKKERMDGAEHGGSRTKEVQNVQKEIDTASKNLANEAPESFSKKISGWWNKCLEWFR